MTILTKEVDMKRMLDKKLPMFIICWVVIIGMVLTASPAFSMDLDFSRGRDRNHERDNSHDRDRYQNRDQCRDRDRYHDRDRCNNRCNTCKKNNQRQTRFVRKNDVLPAIIATGIIAGVTFSLLDNDPAPAPCVTTPTSYPVGGTQSVVASSVVVTAALLNVRSGPGMGKPCVGKFHRGTSLSIMGSRAGWYYVQASSGVTGWVMAQYTSPVGYPVSG
jgi:uncharacterized protein YgiM (DUF1202 family)